MNKKIILEKDSYPIFSPSNDTSLTYIKEKQKELDLKLTDLSKLLNIRKENLSRILNKKRKLTNWHKAAFYYLFKYLESGKFN